MIILNYHPALVPSYNWKLIKCLRRVCFFHEYTAGDVLNHFKINLSLISHDVKMLNEKKLEWVYLKGNSVEIKSEWKLPVAWPSERGEQNMYWFLFCPENCMSCVRLREEREGKPPQVKQLFRDEIIVWLHLFTPMAQGDSAKQHNCLCYLIAASTPVYTTRTFFYKFGRGTFCPAVGFVIKHPSDRLFTSSNKKLILNVSAEGNLRCMYVLRTAP